MPLFEKHILFGVLLGVLSPARANTKEDVIDVEAPSYYKYDAKPSQFPWVVAFGTVEHCMGALVDPSWVLTAAHCLEQSSDPSHYRLELEGGGEGRQVRTAVELRPYPRYQSSITARVRDHGNDIALVRVGRPFASAPTLAMRQAPYATDKRRPCRVLGYVQALEGRGRLLQYVRARARAQCYARDPAALVMRHTICATGTGKQAAHACSGNPGGPLVCPVGDDSLGANPSRAEVVGVSSWNQPGVWCGATSRYTDVGYFRDWIKATINGDTFVLPAAMEKGLKQDPDNSFPCLATRPTLSPRTYIMFFQFVTSFTLL